MVAIAPTVAAEALLGQLLEARTKIAETLGESGQR